MTEVLPKWQLETKAMLYEGDAGREEEQRGKRSRAKRERGCIRSSVASLPRLAPQVRSAPPDDQFPCTSRGRRDGKVVALSV